MDAMDPEVIKKSLFKKDIPWDEGRRKVEYNKIFFDQFHPDLTAKSTLLDEWLSDPRCPVFSMAQQDKIKFNRPDEEDPDCLVGTYYVNICSTLIIISHMACCYHIMLSSPVETMRDSSCCSHCQG